MKNTHECVYQTNRTIYHFIVHQPDSHLAEDEAELLRALANLGGFNRLSANT